MSGRIAGRAVSEVRARFWGLAVGLADRTSPGTRYGYVHPVTARVLRRPLPVVGPVDGTAFDDGPHAGPATPAHLTCVLAADHLDVGGVGRVVEMLAAGLGEHGVRPVVMCPGEGDRAARLRARGIEVVVAPDGAAAGAALSRVQPDVVQLHSAPAPMVHAARSGGHPLVPVLHNTEIHYSPAGWSAASDLFAASAAVVAVSDVVRLFHLDHVSAEAGSRITVVPNGAAPVPPVTAATRARARDALARAVRAPVADDDVVFVCLARYDSQKNITGTVAAFLDAVGAGAPARLVVAGDPSDWLEVRRAAAVRDAHRAAGRVHLLGSSDAAALLAASDAFVLDSFFEGWPLATTEAVAAGLPIVVSDTGGARELVARARTGSVLVKNPTGPASEVDDARACRARRQARHQTNAAELSRAIVGLARTVRRGDLGARPVDDTSYATMVAGHARVLHETARRPAPLDRA